VSSFGLGGLGLIINFSSAMLICQLDDILFESARVHNLKENFEELAENPIKKLNKDNHALMAKFEKISSNLLMLEDGNLNVP
jgi:hypothetical protein